MDNTNFLNLKDYDPENAKEYAQLKQKYSEQANFIGDSTNGISNVNSQQSWTNHKFSENRESILQDYDLTFSDDSNIEDSDCPSQMFKFEKKEVSNDCSFSGNDIIRNDFGLSLDNFNYGQVQNPISKVDNTCSNMVNLS